MTQEEFQARAYLQLLEEELIRVWEALDEAAEFREALQEELDALHPD